MAHAAALAVAEGSRVVIVTAFQEGGDRIAGADGVPDDLRYALSDAVQAQELAERGRGIVSKAGVSKIVVQAIAGDPASVLLEAAKDFDADLIVVGSKGLTSGRTSSWAAWRPRWPTTPRATSSSPTPPADGAHRRLTGSHSAWQDDRT